MTTCNRLRTLLSISAILALALIGAGCGGDDGGGSSEDATALLERAYENEVTSADVSFEVGAELEGVEQLDGPLRLTLEGPYAQDTPKAFPILDWDITAEGAGQEFEVGLIATEENAFVEYQGQSYEVGAELFGQFKQQSVEQQDDFTPQGLKALGVDPTEWLEDAEVEDGDDIGGDSTRVVTGEVDVETVIRDIFELVQSPAIRRQLESQGQALPEIEEPSDEDIQEVEDAIEELRLEINIDENDIVRRTFIEGEFSLPDDVEAGELEGGSINFEFVLNDVDIDPEIEAPADARPLSELTQQFGLGGGLTPGAPGLPPGGFETP